MMLVAKSIHTKVKNRALHTRNWQLLLGINDPSKAKSLKVADYPLDYIKKSEFKKRGILPKMDLNLLNIDF